MFDYAETSTIPRPFTHLAALRRFSENFSMVACIRQTFWLAVFAVGHAQIRAEPNDVATQTSLSRKG
jgi:hypothetical protein